MSFRKEDIVLILPPRRWKDNRYSLGLLYVSASLRASGFDNIIIERGLFKEKFKTYDFELVKNLILDKVREIKPKIVGFTVNVQEFDQIIELNTLLKKEMNIVTIVGGPQSTARPSEFLRQGVDVAVVGEGEATVVELVKMLQYNFEQQKDFNEIKKQNIEGFKNILGIAYQNL